MEGDKSRPVPEYRGVGREVLEEGEPIDGQDPPPFPGWMSADDPATISFNDTIWKAMKILENKGISFSALELFASSIGPTVTISCAVIPEEVDDIVLNLRDAIYPTDLFPKIVFSETEALRVQSEYTITVDHYSRAPCCGSSLGVNGVEWAQGSLGGYLEDENGVVYAITCHHVGLPTRDTKKAEDGKRAGEPDNVELIELGPFGSLKIGSVASNKASSEESKEKEGNVAKISEMIDQVIALGIDLGSPRQLTHQPCPESLATNGKFHSALETNPENALTIVQPADGDHIRTVNLLATNILESHKEIDALKLRSVELGKPIPARVDGLKELINMYAKDLKIILNADRLFGHIVASSGYRINPDSHNLNWCLIRVAANRICLNTYGNTVTLANAPDTKRWSFLAGHFTIREKRQPRADDECFFRGRTSGCQYGRIHGPRTGILLRGIEKKTVEWTAIGLDCLTFAKEGDIGSFMVNQEGHLVGMVIGFNRNATYFTRIEDVLKHIKDQTGLELKLV